VTATGRWRERGRMAKGAISPCVPTGFPSGARPTGVDVSRRARVQIRWRMGDRTDKRIPTALPVPALATRP
jgi:hypothetical protein